VCEAAQRHCFDRGINTFAPQRQSLLVDRRPPPPSHSVRTAHTLRRQVYVLTKPSLDAAAEAAAAAGTAHAGPRTVLQGPFDAQQQVGWCALARTRALRSVGSNSWAVAYGSASAL